MVYYYYQRPDSIVNTRQDSQNMESVAAGLHMVEIYQQMGQRECAARWFGIVIQYIQELRDRQPGIALTRERVSREQIRQLLKDGRLVSRAKWFLMRYPKLYDAVFGVKRAVTKLLVRE